LPESILKEAEAAWSKVVATVNNVHPDSLESQYYPLFAERVTEPLVIEGKNFLNNFRSLIAFCPVRIATILSKVFVCVSFCCQEFFGSKQLLFSYFKIVNFYLSNFT